MKWKQVIFSMLLAIIFGIIVAPFILFAGWISPNTTRIGVLLLFILPTTLITIFTRKKWVQFSRVYFIISIIIFLSIATFRFFPYEKFPSIGWGNYSIREPITESRADRNGDNYVTTNFGKITQQSSVVGMIFSPNGRKVAYSEHLQDGTNRQQAFVVDEKGKRPIGVPQETIVGLAFSKNSEHLAYIAWRHNKNGAIEFTTSVVDGVIQGWQKGNDSELGTDYVAQNALEKEARESTKICPNIKRGSKQGFFNFGGPLQFIEINGHKSHASSSVEPIVYSANCQKIAFVVPGAGEKIVIVGDSEGFTEASKHMDYNEAFRLPQFSPDGNIITYAGTDKEQNIWWVAEKLQK